MCLILKQNILMILYVKHTIWHISLDEFYRGHRHLNNVMIGEKKKEKKIAKTLEVSFHGQILPPQKQPLH